MRSEANCAAGSAPCSTVGRSHGVGHSGQRVSLMLSNAKNPHIKLHKVRVVAPIENK